MIKNIENKEVTVLVTNEKIKLSRDLQSKVDEYWKKVVLDNPELWDGEICCVTEIIETEKELKIICKTSNYSHYIYDERVGIKEHEGCKNLSAGAVMETLDGYYVVGEMAENTSVPGMIQEPGGNVDRTDGKDSKIDIWRTIQREVKEEVNIDIFDETQVKSKKVKYLGRVKENALGYMIFAKVDLKMTSNELEQHFMDYLRYLKENNLEIEFGKLHFLKKETVLQDLANIQKPLREYLRTFV